MLLREGRQRAERDGRVQAREYTYAAKLSDLWGNHLALI